MSSAPSPHAASSPHHSAQAQEVEEKRKILEAAISENTDSLLRWVLRQLGRMNVQENSHARTRADIAGDVLADACCAVLKNAHRFESDRDPVLWIKGCALNYAKRHREHIFGANRTASERREASASELSGEEQSGEDFLEEQAATRDVSLGLLKGRRSSQLETEQALGSLLKPLSEAEQQIITLSVFAGYDSQRMAAQLGIAPAAARKRLQRALDHLRAHIRSHPGEFSWLENLPSLLAQLDGDASAAKNMARGQRDNGSARHTKHASKQHLLHDPPQAQSIGSADASSKLAAARNSGMTLSSLNNTAATSAYLDGTSSSDPEGSAPVASGGKSS